jgi:hypothetical protein
LAASQKGLSSMSSKSYKKLFIFHDLKSTLETPQAPPVGVLECYINLLGIFHRIPRKQVTIKALGMYPMQSRSSDVYHLQFVTIPSLQQDTIVLQA